MTSRRIARAVVLLWSAWAPAVGAQVETDAVIADRCVGCHSGPAADASLDLESFRSGADDAASLRLLIKIRNRVRDGEMPPTGETPLGASVRDAFVTAATQRLVAVASARALDPGRVTIRRLSRFEYDRTTRDLLGVATELSSLFPAEDLGYGFDNIGDAASFSQIHLEKYLAAAEDLAARSVITEDPSNPPVQRLEGEAMTSPREGVVGEGDTANLYSNGFVHAPMVLPRDGDYVVRAFAFANQAGGEVARMALRIDGKAVAEWDVPATREAPAVYERTLGLTGGRREVAIGFVNDYYDPDHPEREQRDRNLYVDWVEVRGPVDAPKRPFAHHWIFAADPGRGSAAQRAGRVLNEMLGRLWRRPAKRDEVRRLVKLVESRLAVGESFEEGIRLALVAALTSPHFLFRVEPGAAAKTAPPRDLDDFALATRLSYFLWSSAPDEALREAAATKKLRDPTLLRAEAARLLADGRADALAVNFAAQWLELRNLIDAQPDRDRFPEFDEALRASMVRESERLFLTVMRERRDVRDLVDADFTFVDRRLAAHYGIDGVDSDVPVRIAVTDPHRRGLLGHASILTLTSSPTRTSPVKRGKWLLETLLDAPPPPPPPEAGSLAKEEELARPADLRQRLAIHRAAPDCAVCHLRMDALGFALENYDAIGRWRELDGDRAIDASGELPDGRKIDGPIDLRAVLVEGDALVRSLTKKLFVYAVGREPALDDLLGIEALIAALPKQRVTIEDIILGIVELAGFRRRSGGR